MEGGWWGSDRQKEVSVWREMGDDWGGWVIGGVS